MTAVLKIYFILFDYAHRIHNTRMTLKTVSGITVTELPYAFLQFVLTCGFLSSIYSTLKIVNSLIRIK